MTEVTEVPPAPATPLLRWQDPTLDRGDRVSALLAQMTLEEKVAQLGSRWLHGASSPPDAEDGAESALNIAPAQDVFAAGESLPLEVASRYGLGHLTRVYGSVPVTPQEGAAELVHQQRIVLGNDRLGVPALVHEECLTGLTSFGATTYPTPLAWGATFNPALVERMAAAIGRDMAGLGIHQGLAPVLDVVRDYRWGRVEESIGEDPYLVAMLGTAYVRGLQGSGVIATLKHFAGYSASRAARNHGPVSMGRRELLDVILPPFEMAVRDGEVRSVMNSYADVDGQPAGADPWLLSEVLRNRWGFTGTVVSDYWSVPFLATMHRVAANAGDAGGLALAAGVDVELPDTIGFGDDLVARVRSGAVEERLVDRAAQRMLLQKIDLGLLDADWTPEVSVARAADTELDSAANRALAREVAEQSIVLLDAGSALPLLGAGRPEHARVAVVGPCADDARTLLGCYSFANHVAPRHPGAGLGIDVPTPLAALRAELPHAEVVFERGCAVDRIDRSGFTAARAVARGADLCIAFVGDLAGLFGQGTSGEGCDVANLRLPGVQADLVGQLLDTGTPVVVVVVSGRPYALGDIAGRAAGLVQAFMPGEEGAGALAGILSGRVMPSGKLPVQIPREADGQPSTYLQPPLGGVEANGITSVDSTPLFPFGFGKSYTEFVLDNVRSSASSITTDGAVEVCARLTNTGTRAGSEVIQLYLHDRVAQVARPVRALIGFARVTLAPGEAGDVRFLVHADRFAYTGPDYERIVEAGDVELLLGNSATELPHLHGLARDRINPSGRARPTAGDSRRRDRCPGGRVT